MNTTFKKTAVALAAMSISATSAFAISVGDNAQYNSNGQSYNVTVVAGNANGTYQLNWGYNNPTTPPGQGPGVANAPGNALTVVVLPAPAAPKPVAPAPAPSNGGGGGSSIDDAAAKKAALEEELRRERAQQAEQEAKLAAAKARLQAAKEADAKKAANHSLKVGARTRDTNSAVGGAIGVNILADEFINPALEQFGATIGSGVGGNFENPEVRLGVSVDLSKHFGEDFEGVSVNAGFGVESGELSVGARKTWRVAEYVTTSVGASVGAEGIRVGPELMLGNADFGVGVALWGPLPVPQIKVFGYTAAVVPHLAVANAIVGVTTIAYKAIRSEVSEPGADDE